MDTANDTVPVRDAKEIGARVEALLAELRFGSGLEAAAAAEELVTCLVRLYGTGLETIMRTIGDDSRRQSSGGATPRTPRGSADGEANLSTLQALLIADPLVESLLLVHDLHPLDASTRIRRALGRLGTGAEFIGIDDAGVAHIRLGKGCGSMAGDVEQAVTDAAPDIAGVTFAPREVPLLQITRRPAGAT